jgi:hypothetical protein
MTVIGAIVGCVLAVLLICALVIFLRKRSARNKQRIRLDLTASVIKPYQDPELLMRSPLTEPSIYSNPTTTGYTSTGYTSQPLQSRRTTTDMSYGHPYQLSPVTPPASAILSQPPTSPGPSASASHYRRGSTSTTGVSALSGYSGT